MGDDKTTDILKRAIMMEKRGQAFYEKVAQQTSGNAVKRFFQMMADEEKDHIRILFLVGHHLKKTFHCIAGCLLGHFFIKGLSSFFHHNCAF